MKLTIQSAQVAELVKREVASLVPSFEGKNLEVVFNEAMEATISIVEEAPTIKAVKKTRKPRAKKVAPVRVEVKEEVVVTEKEVSNGSEPEQTESVKTEEPIKISPKSKAKPEVQGSLFSKPAETTKTTDSEPPFEPDPEVKEEKEEKPKTLFGKKLKEAK